MRSNLVRKEMARFVIVHDLLKLGKAKKGGKIIEEKGVRGQVKSGNRYLADDSGAAWRIETA